MLHAISCRPDKPALVGDYSSFSIESFQGQWRVSKVTQNDEDAIRKNFPFKSLDVTNDFGFNQTVINIVPPAANGAKNFSINYGEAPMLFRFTNGTWALDNIKAPSQLFLINGTDTLKAAIANYRDLQNRKLVLKIFKEEAGVKKLSYEYSLTK